MEKTKAVLAVLNNYIVICSFYILAMSILGNTDISVMGLCLFVIIPFAFYGIRLKVHRFLAFTAVHIAVAALWYGFIGLAGYTLLEKILHLAMIVYYILVSYSVKVKTEDKIEGVISPAAIIVMPLVGFALIKRYGTGELKPVIFILLIIYFAFYMANQYVDNYRTFVKVNKISVGRFQSKKLLKLGSLLIIGYIMLVAVVLTFFMNEEIGNTLAEGLKNGLFVILRLLLSLIRDKGEVTEVVEEEVVSEATEPMMMLPELQSEGGFIAAILEKLIPLVFVVVMVYAVVLIIKKIRELFRDKDRNVVVESESGVSEITEQLEREASHTWERYLNFGISINARIRKTYYKHVMANKKSIEQEKHLDISSSTARELVEETATCYEKARYSGEDCTAAEYKELKKNLSKIQY